MKSLVVKPTSPLEPLATSHTSLGSPVLASQSTSYKMSYLLCTGMLYREHGVEIGWSMSEGTLPLLTREKGVLRLSVSKV